MHALLVLAALVGQIPDAVFENPAPWKLLSNEGGLSLECRPIKDSAVYEYRVITQTEVSVSALCRHIFEWGTVGKDVEASNRKLLRDSPDERVVYDQVQKPVVSDRDYAMTVTRWTDEAGVCRIRFRATNQFAPKLQDGWVRLDKMWGSWTFEPTAAAGMTRLTYTLFADPSGSVPAFLVHGTHRASALNSVKQGIAKAKQAEASAK